MQPPTSEQVRRIVGAVDDETAADIPATGASDDELLEAVARVRADDAVRDRLRPLASGRVGRLVAILQADEPLESGAAAPPPRALTRPARRGHAGTGNRAGPR